MNELQKEIDKRLTFAIISHPDAGKTTITEKLLYFGGAIHMAGAVKSKKNTRKTVSDFMELERQRGISISTSVMGFHYKERMINLLDTPGHADFSEDTYRTLTAVDSALMVIDSVKGVEERTRKLCEVCRMRTTPIITFINKLDREGLSPVELLDELEKELNIKVIPMSWPIGRGRNFKGVYSLFDKRLVMFKSHEASDSDSCIEINDLADKKLDEIIGSDAARLREDIELINGIYPEFDQREYLTGNITPVFFGSAINNFGVKELLDCFVNIAPGPIPRETEDRIVDPEEAAFSGLVFKIHANLDPRHRDRIAFMRICSGIFRRNKLYYHVRTGKSFKSSNPTAFMAQERNIIETAYPGDIIGLHDTGNFKIGDTLTEGELLQFTGIPSFAPQIFKAIINTDPMRSKQLDKGLSQLSEEGVVQLFTRVSDNLRLLGVVGVLQFDVIQHRLLQEYKASCKFEPADYNIACWIKSDDKKEMDKFIKFRGSNLAKDREGQIVFLAGSKWIISRTMEENPEIDYYFTSDCRKKAERIIW